MRNTRKVSSPASPSSPLDHYPIELVAIETLSPHPKNYREHPEDQLAHLRQSLREFGVIKNIVVSQDNYILAGHGLALAARQLKWEKLPVRRLPLTHLEPLALKLVVADNETSRLGVRDDRALSELLQELHRPVPSALLGTGYDAASVEELTQRLRPVPKRLEKPQDTSWQLVVHFGTEAAMRQFLREQRLSAEQGAVRALHVMTGRLWSTWYTNDNLE
jgi:hypothetical protein